MAQVFLKLEVEGVLDVDGPPGINSLVCFGVICFNVPVGNIILVFVVVGSVSKISTGFRVLCVVYSR